MENVRGLRCTGCPDLTAFYWRSEGDKLVAVGVMDLCDGRSSVWMCIYFELCGHVVGEICFQSTQLSGVLNGKVTVVLHGVFAIMCAVVRQSLGTCVSWRHHQSRAELGSMPS